MYNRRVMINAYRAFRNKAAFLSQRTISSIQKIVEKFAIIIFHESLSCGIQYVPSGRRDMTKNIIERHIST